jgi:hypothetical protein
LHETVQLGDVLTIGPLRGDRENGDDCGDNQQREAGSDLGAISNKVLHDFR